MNLSPGKTARFGSACVEMPMRTARWVQLYFFGAAVILFITAVLKTAAALSSTPGSYHKDLVFWFLTRRELSALAAGLELVVVAILICSPKTSVKLVACAWLGAVFLLYRLSLWWLGSSFESCGCLGKLSDLNINSDWSAWIAEIFLLYLLGGPVLAFTAGALSRLALSIRCKRFFSHLVRFRGRCGLYFLMVGFGPASSYASGLDFSIAGVLVQTQERATDTNVLASYSFQVWMRDPVYAIKAIAHETDERRLMAREAVFDGENTYYFRRWNTNRIAGSVLRLEGQKVVLSEAPAKIKNHADVIIKQGLVPPGDSIDELQVIWVAFVGQLVYSARNSSASGEPLTTAPPVLENARLETSYQRDAGEIGFISRLTHRYSASGISTRLGIMQPTLPEASHSSGSLGRKAFTNAFYSVTGWTNVGEVMFPAAFRMERYGWEMLSNPRQRFAFSGLVTNVVLGGTQTIAPAFQPRLYVTERRPDVIGSGGSFTYFSQDGHVMTKEELEQDKNFTIAMAARRNRRAPTDITRLTIALGFFLLLVLPPAIYAVVWRRKRQPQL